MKQPWTRREEVVDEVGGRRVADPYRWLEPDDSAECARWLQGQQWWLREQAGAWQGPREVFSGLLGRFVDAGSAIAPVSSPPVWRAGRRFFLQRSAGQERPVLMAWDAQDGPRVVLDPLRIDRSGRTALWAWRPSWTGRLVACQLSVGGSEAPLLQVVDVSTGCAVGPVLRPGRMTAVAWLPGDRGLLYVTCPADGGPRQVRLHPVAGDAPDGGALAGDEVQGPGEAVVFTTAWRQLSVSISPCGRWLVVSCAPGAQSGNQLHLADLAAAPVQDPGWSLVHDGTATGVQAVIKFGPGGLLYAITTDQSPAGRICRIDPARPEAGHWTPLITPDGDTVLSACAVLTEPATCAPRMLVSSTRRGAAALSLHDSDGHHLADIPAPGPGTISQLTTPPGPTSQAWFTYTDFLTPPAVYRFDLHDGRCHPDTPPPGNPEHHPEAAQRPEAGQPQGGRVEPETGQPLVAAQVRQVTYPADDGTPIPLFLITPAGHEAGGGPRPALMTAYGGFGASAAPAFSPTIAAWVSAGGLYAICGVRGGGERGTTWHEAGRARNKPTAFADYAACARWLIDEGFTTPSRLAIKGASHAGLMVAAALTRDPELYAAAVCAGAPTDMVRYPHLGMGPWWIPEFGDPADPEQLNVLLSYSPYHRIQPGTSYPAVLLMTSRTDERVGAAHTRKFTAALQHATTSSGPVVLRCEDGIGHTAGTASRWTDAEAEALAFCATHTGLQPRAHHHHSYAPPASTSSYR